MSGFAVNNQLMKGKAKAQGVSFPEPMIQAIKTKADKLDRTFSWVVRKAVQKYLIEETE